MKHYGIQPTTSKPSTIETYRRHWLTNADGYSCRVRARTEAICEIQLNHEPKPPIHAEGHPTTSEVILNMIQGMS